MSPDQANQQMVDRMIAEGVLWSPPLMAAFRATPRHRFLDRVFLYQRKSGAWREIITRDPEPDRLRILYSDRALITHLSPDAMPISSSSQPSLMAQMLADLKLEAGLRVLEIGSGTGYNAALLSNVVGPGLVTSIDVDRDVLSEAWDHLRGFPDRQVDLHHADGREGYAEKAPYDRVMVTAATPDLEPAWLEQLADGGLLLAPLNLAPGLAFIACGNFHSPLPPSGRGVGGEGSSRANTGDSPLPLCGREAGGEGFFQGHLTRAAYFMPLRSEDESGSQETEAIPPGRELRTIPAPWAGWFDRRGRRLNWLGFSQSLAFFGFIRGLTVHYQALDGVNQPVFGFSDPARKEICWLGSLEWRVSGEAGRDLGWNLWRDFLDLGGPWPTEFRLKASRTGGLLSALPPRQTFFQQGPKCQWLWELIEPRERHGWI